jgi:hypothetical protein
MNRRQFRSDTEAAWELRPGTDETPGSGLHHNRFSRPAAKPMQVKTAEKVRIQKKNGENGS